MLRPFPAKPRALAAGAAALIGLIGLSGCQQTSVAPAAKKATVEKATIEKATVEKEPADYATVELAAPPKTLADDAIMEQATIEKVIAAKATVENAIAAITDFVKAINEKAAAEKADAEKAAEKSILAGKPGRASIATVAGLEWNTDYNTAYRAAKRAKRMLLINITPSGENAQQEQVEQYIAANPALQSKLEQVQRARVPVDAELTVDGKVQKLLSFGAFAEMHGGPGFVLIDLRNVGQPYYGHAVNVLPYASGKYYHWRSDYLPVVLDLPPGTLTQRTMVWAVRVHPERPASTFAEQHPTLAQGATQHSSYQASIGVQGHHHFESRYGQLSGAAGGSVSEVVAESWPDQNMIDSCIDCVSSWRQSPGHWGAVVRRHRAFGYDIRRGRNGIWYGTGIFAD